MVIDVAIFHQVIQLDGACSQQFFQRLLYRMQREALHHSTAGASYVYFQKAVLLQHPQGLPHTGAAAVELLCQFPLRGKRVAGAQNTGGYFLINLIVNHLGSPLRRGGLKEGIGVLGVDHHGALLTLLHI